MTDKKPDLLSQIMAQTNANENRRTILEVLHDGFGKSGRFHKRNIRIDRDKGVIVIDDKAHIVLRISNRSGGYGIEIDVKDSMLAARDVINDIRRALTMTESKTLQNISTNSGKDRVFDHWQDNNVQRSRGESARIIVKIDEAELRELKIKLDENKQRGQTAIGGMFPKTTP